MQLAIIGDGAIGGYVRNKACEHGHDVRAVLLRPERLKDPAKEAGDILCVSGVSDLPRNIDHVVDCAGHTALTSYGPDILRRGINLTTVSLGALADPNLFDRLERAATEGQSKLCLASGAIGALDCLRAARVGTLEHVTYIGRKPPLGWQGSPAETRLDLDNLTAGPATHFEGSARNAATEYPKNANVAAAVALAGIGFDRTHVQLIADPDITENIHEVRATGEFGRFSFEISGNSLTGNPRSSILAAMSVISTLDQASQRIVF